MQVKKNKHFTAKGIIAALEKHNRILKKYSVKRIGLFGSYARGEQKPESDIDFLVDFEEPAFDNFMELAFFLEGLFKKRVELVTNGSLSPYMRPYVEKEVQWHEA